MLHHAELELEPVGPKLQITQTQTCITLIVYHARVTFVFTHDDNTKLCLKYCEYCE